MALTQPLAVEPLRWVLRGVAAQCFVVNRIFKYYYSPQLATNNLFFRTIFTQKNHDFLTFAKLQLFQFLVTFLCFFSTS
jgi:hypothetical protein